MMRFIKSAFVLSCSRMSLLNLPDCGFLQIFSSIQIGTLLSYVPIKVAMHSRSSVQPIRYCNYHFYLGEVKSGLQRWPKCRTFILEVLYFHLATLASLRAWKAKPSGNVGWFGACLIAHLHVTIGVSSSNPPQGHQESHRHASKYHLLYSERHGSDMLQQHDKICLV